MVIYMFQYYSLILSHPCLLHSPKVCSLHLCLFCCLAYRVVVTIFLHSIYMCWYTVLVFLFLTYFTLYNRLQFHPSHWNWFKCIIFNCWVVFHCVYVSQLSYPFICQWTSRLLPCPGYYKVLRWTLGCMCLFQFWFPWCVCPAVGLLGHKAVLFPVF